MKPIKLQLIVLITLAGLLSAAVGAQGQVPVITRPPQGTSILVGSTVNLSVQGSGATAYLWLLNSNAIATATASSYTISNIQKTNEGAYQVVLSNSSGSVTSVIARVTVVIADIPAITNELVAHYTFEHNPNDSSQHGNDGTDVGTTVDGTIYTVSGKTGGAARRCLSKQDGSEFDFVTLGIPSDFEFGGSTDFSVSFWIQFTNVTGEFPLIANRDWSNGNNQGWGIATGADGRLRWNVAGPPGSAKIYDGTPGALNDGVWHHVAVTFQRNGNATTYLDGAVVNVQSLAGSSNDLTTPAGLALNLCQDGTGAYTASGTAGIDAAMDDLGIWRRAITADEAALIFAKGTRGVNLEQDVFNNGGGQATRVTGQWDFDQSDLRATVGQALDYGDGAGGPMALHTTFGTTTSYGIPDIGSQVARVMKYERNDTPPANYVQGYTMHHGIAPNGGGTLVNRWTLIADLLFPSFHSAGSDYSAILEIQNDTGSDADLSIHEESPGVGGIGISGQYQGNITVGQWHRLVVAVDMSAGTPVISKFVDGVKAADQTTVPDGLDGRFALSDVAHLFSDGGGDNEVNTYYVNSVQIRDGKLADDEVAALGGPQAAGIPLNIPSGPPVTQPRLTTTTSISGNNLTISWDAAATGYGLESSSSLTNPNWLPVSGVNNNSVVVDTSTGTRFYRLKK